MMETGNPKAPAHAPLRIKGIAQRRLRASIGTPSPAELLDDACAALRAQPDAVDLPERLSLYGASRLDTSRLHVLAALTVLGLVAITFYSAFAREVARTLSLGKLQFGFNARTKDWILLYLGNVGLTLATLGIGYIFVVYRNWTFAIRHAEAYGEVQLEDMTMSTTKEPGQGEGLLDAFDVGAF